jgi:Lar family restriction alleviation protein
MNEIKPCPFCGCDSVWVHLDDWGGAVAECNECDARGPLAHPTSVSRILVSPPDEDKLALAAELWNRQPRIIPIWEQTAKRVNNSHYG